MSYILPGAESLGPLATELMLARKGRTLRRMKGQPVIFQWMFWDNGRQVALETGPLHFDLMCELVDVSSGKQISSYDCYHELGPKAPDWVRALESSRR